MKGKKPAVQVKKLSRKCFRANKGKAKLGQRHGSKSQQDPETKRILHGGPPKGKRPRLIAGQPGKEKGQACHHKNWDSDC